jgi:hypothetical protein
MVNLQPVQFFRQNPLACPITNSHLLSNVVNGPTSILTDKLSNSCNSFKICAACESPCVFIIINWCGTGYELGMPMKHPHTTQDSVPEGLLNHCQHLHNTFPKSGIKSDVHCSFSDPSQKLPQVTYMTPNKHVWKMTMSTQLRVTWHNDSLDMAVLPSTGASSHHNCCVNGGTSPEHFGYHLIMSVQLAHN